MKNKIITFVSYRIFLNLAIDYVLKPKGMF